MNTWPSVFYSCTLPIFYKYKPKKNGKPQKGLPFSEYLTLALGQR